MWIAALAVAALAALHLIVSGQPWGVVYGLGLWTAKATQLFAVDLTGSMFWAAPAQQVRLAQTIFSDVTSLTNIGLVLGAFAIATWRGDLGRDRITTADRLGDGDHCWVIDGLFFSACVWVQCGSIFQRYLDRKPAWLGLASGRVCRFLFRVRLRPRLGLA